MKEYPSQPSSEPLASRKVASGSSTSDITLRFGLHPQLLYHHQCINTCGLEKKQGSKMSLKTFALLKRRWLCRSYKMFPSKQEPILESKAASPVGLPTNIPKGSDIQLQQPGQWRVTSSPAATPGTGLILRLNLHLQVQGIQGIQAPDTK